jgi:5'-nucleotidase
MDILLTNDDSHASPLLRFIVDKMQTLGHVTLVVPKEEQSWTGKSMSRFRYLYLDTIALYDGHAYCVDGTPADCINMGIFNIMQRQPDLVVSGINIGRNTGLGFVLSSGTIGACLEANLAGVPAVALSQDLERSVFQTWTHERRFPEAERQRLNQQTSLLLDQVFKTLCAREDFWHTPVTWNVNLPYQAAPDWQIVPTFLGHTSYGACFKQNGDRYQHALEAVPEDSHAQADSTVLRQGHVSLTSIDLRDLGHLRPQSV